MLVGTAVVLRTREIRTVPSSTRRTLLDALEASEKKETTCIDVLFTTSADAFVTGEEIVRSSLARFIVSRLVTRSERRTFCCAPRKTIAGDLTGTSSSVKVMAEPPDESNGEVMTRKRSIMKRTGEVMVTLERGKRFPRSMIV